MTQNSLDSILTSLTTPQRQAVQHVDGPMLVLAGPGSGKTRVVTHRIAYLLSQGISPTNILALTFTNKAADEMRMRLAAMAPGAAVWMGTFHRFCARLLRRHSSLVGLSENYSIYDADDSRRTLLQILNEDPHFSSMYTPEQIANRISWAKGEVIGADEFQPRSGDAFAEIVLRAYRAYQRRLLASNAVDFDDLLLHVARLLRDHAEIQQSLDERHQYILVDEYQDTNTAQYVIVRAISNRFPNLAVTGDPDQSIYGWRGANLKNILHFERDYPKVRVVRLEQNYRSTKSVLRVADELISHNIQRKPKSLFTENEQGPPVRLTTYPTHIDEAGRIAAQIADEVSQQKRRLRDYAILYRNNALSRTLEKELAVRGVAYQIVNGLAFYERKEIRDLLAYLHTINNPLNEIALLRIINRPARGIGKTTVDRLIEAARQADRPLLELAREHTFLQSLTSQTAAAMRRFIAIWDRLFQLADAPVEEILGHVLDQTGYQRMLTESNEREDQERLANIEELLTAAREFDARKNDDEGLEEFLEQCSLVSDIDGWEGENQSITLMTLHAAKGLEFPVVFIVALEDGILPHERNRNALDRLEEERRLLFVGITRAEHELHLSYAEKRAYRGSKYTTTPSSFLMEMPRTEMDLVTICESWTAAFDDDEPPRPQEFDDAIHESCEELVYSQEPAQATADSLPPKHTVDVSENEAPPADVGELVVSGKLRTAAEMLTGEQRIGRYSPNVFKQGMLVQHPEYGDGEIIALSGSGRKRQATIKFFGEAGEKKMRLWYTPLEPVSR